MSSWFKATASFSGISGTTVCPDDLPMTLLKPDDTKTGKPEVILNGHNDGILPTPVQLSVKKKNAPIKSFFRSYGKKLMKQLGDPEPPSESSSEIDDSLDMKSPRVDNSHQPPIDPSGEVDEVVVDRTWTDEVKTSDDSSPEWSGEPGGAPALGSGTHGERITLHNGKNKHYDDDFAHSSSWFWIIWRITPLIGRFFNSSFENPKVERHFRDEAWLLKKNLALWASIWYIINWVLGTIFARNNSGSAYFVTDLIFYFGVAPLFSLPLLFFVMYNVPRDHPLFYQIFLVISVWIWSFYLVIYMVLCDFYGQKNGAISCGGKDFIGIFYYTTAMQTIALFGLKLKRLPAAVGATAFFVFSCAAIIPDRVTWIRSMLNFAFYHAFLLYTHYQRELAERRLYQLRDELKKQYKVTYKAQLNERRAAESKRRLTSYVFHEVRVPLNTALLATQNIAAGSVINKDQEIELNALIGSLNIMSKVLNDVLDFNRMDSGKLESLSRPYAFHQVMRSLLEPMRITTDARKLEFEYSLDPNIDLVARRAAYSAMGENNAAIEAHIKASPDVDGVVTGDETRLRQIITNLASNSCKFTPPGGKLKITTKLIRPPPDSKFDVNIPASEGSSQISSGQEKKVEGGVVVPNGHVQLSSMHLSQHNMDMLDGAPSTTAQFMVVRIEVTDTGYGIKPEDMAIAKLFSAFNQTEQGRTQGGKGTGLGLALVRQIVKLSGGRLGVKSKVDHGSTFWIELPVGIGRNTLIKPGRPDLESENSGSGSNGDEAKIRSAAVSGKLPKRTTGAVSEAVDAVALSASQPVPEAIKSASAIHGLLEQRGRVDFVINNDSATSMSLRNSGDRVSPTAENIPPTTTKAARPTFVEMPKLVPLHDPNRSPDSSFSQESVQMNTSNLVQFDLSMTRSSPSTLAQASPLTGETLHVLVVDDDHVTRVLMTRILNRLGCRVTTATNGEVALGMILGYLSETPASDNSQNAGPLLERVAKKPNYDLVFLDNQMPVMSGLAMVAKLRELERDDFIVGVTGNALLTDQNEYLEAGADRVLTKPVFERSLKDMLVIAQERRRKRSRKPPNDSAGITPVPEDTTPKPEDFQAVDSIEFSKSPSFDSSLAKVR